MALVFKKRYLNLGLCKLADKLASIWCKRLYSHKDVCYLDVYCVFGLMRQYSPPSLVCTTFSQTFVVLVLFSRGYSFHLDCFGNWLMIKFKFCIIKARLGGDFCLAEEREICRLA